MPERNDEPLRLLFVSHSFPPEDAPMSNVGGMQRVATELYAALERTPDVALTSELLRASWRTTHLRVPGFLLRVLRRLRRVAADDSVDVVLFSSMVTATMAIPVRKALARAGIRTAAIVHGRDVTLPTFAHQKLVVPRVFAALDAVLPVSQATGEACLERGLPPEKLHVVPNGIDVSRFDPPDDRAAARRAFLEGAGVSLPEDALLLCSVGRHVPRKGFAWFADAVMPLLPENVYWWLVGDGPETPVVEAAIARHGLENRVYLPGRISDARLAHLYRGADLFVMPNRPVAGDMEGFGVVMLEAGLAGMPTVGAGIEGIRDVITENVNGHLLPTGDARAFARVLARYAADRAALRDLVPENSGPHPGDVRVGGRGAALRGNAPAGVTLSGWPPAGRAPRSTGGGPAGRRARRPASCQCPAPPTARWSANRDGNSTAIRRSRSSSSSST